MRELLAGRIAGADLQGCFQIKNFNGNTAIGHDARSACAQNLMAVFVVRDQDGIGLVAAYIKAKYTDLSPEQVETKAKSKTYRCDRHSRHSAPLLDDMRVLVDASTKFHQEFVDASIPCPCRCKHEWPRLGCTA